jgi:hypothetical protein
MRKLAFALTAIVGFGAIGCDDEPDLDDLDDLDDIDVPPEVTVPVAPAVLEWQATLADTDSTTNITGEARVTETEDAGSFRATISISDSSTCSRPWHVHYGTCESGGDIVGDPASYTNLVSASDGTASADVVVAASLDPSQPYHVNVHYSDSQLGRIVACGDLVLTTVALQ